MQTHRLVVTEDLNQYGFLFGGKLLSWVDEASFIAASLEFPDARFVTVGMDKVEFRHSVKNGSILAICCERVRLGKTSVSYEVKVYRGKVPDGEIVFSTRVSFVNIDTAGQNVAIEKDHVS